MGNFYVNFCARASATEVFDALNQLRVDVFVGPEERGWCCFADAESETQDPSLIDAVGLKVSALLGGPVLSFLNHDDDVLSVDLFLKERRVAEYNSCPGYFESDASADDLKPRFTNASAFAEINPPLTERDLQEALGPEIDEFLTADEVHERWVELLNLPTYSVGFGHRYADRGEFPADAALFRRIKGD